jgi:hypothetical protein
VIEHRFYLVFLLIFEKINMPSPAAGHSHARSSVRRRQSKQSSWNLTGGQ